MILYFESNFLLELSLQQEQAGSVHTLLTHAENKAIALVCPTLALCEPFSNINYRRVERRQLTERLTAFSERELKRSPEHFPALQNIQSLLGYTESLDNKQEENLQRDSMRLLRCCRLLPMDDYTIGYARSFQQSHDLRLSDAIVAASIFCELERLAAHKQMHPSIFASRDSKAFGKLSEELRKYQCSFIPSFEDTCSRIKAALSVPPK